MFTQIRFCIVLCWLFSSFSFAADDAGATASPMQIAIPPSAFKKPVKRTLAELQEAKKAKEFYHINLPLQEPDVWAAALEEKCARKKPMGEGVFSTVYSVSANRVVKKLQPYGVEGEKKPTRRAAFKNEVEILRRLHNSGITPQFYGAWAGVEESGYYLCMEKTRPDLSTYRLLFLAKKKPITLAWLEIFSDTIKTALQVMQEKKVWHNDLSAKSIMVEDSGAFVLIDWGSPDVDKKEKVYVGPSGTYTMTYAFSRILLDMICVYASPLLEDLFIIFADDFEEQHKNECGLIAALRSCSTNVRLNSLLDTVEALRSPEAIIAEEERRRAQYDPANYGAHEL